MSESMMQCSDCGEFFPTRLQEMDDKGNPICPECAEKERELTKQDSTQQTD